jgi:hypothetical protein
MEACQMATDTLTVTLPELHAGQRRVLSEMRQHNFLVAGRRWRKTTFAMSFMVESALALPAEYVWSAPTFKQVRLGWDEMRRGCAEVAQFNQGRMDATFINGSVVHFLSMEDYNNNRGFTSFGTVIDEASEIAREAYTAVIRPQLFGTDGWLLALGTPKGHTWFYEEYTAAQLGDRPHSACWQIPTLGAHINADSRALVRAPHAYENPEFTFKQLQEEYDTLPERYFRQEYLAEFLDDAGGVFHNVMGCIRGELQAGPAHSTRQYAIGLDLAKHQDYTVLTIMDLAARQVVGFERFNQADWTLQKARIVATALKWNNALVWMDATGVGDPIYDDLRAAGLRIHPYVFTHASKDALTNNAVLLVEQGEVGYPNIPPMIADLKALEYQRTSAGTLRIAAPEGGHDDCVFSFCLACWALARGNHTTIPADVFEQLRAPISQIGGINILRKTF